MEIYSCASPYILDMIDSCYRIPLYFMPPVSFSDNNKSALANAGFVEEAISKLLLTNHSPQARSG